MFLSKIKAEQRLNTTITDPLWNHFSKQTESMRGHAHARGSKTENKCVIEEMLCFCGRYISQTQAAGSALGKKLLQVMFRKSAAK